jgi:hypothetical protein
MSAGGADALLHARLRRHAGYGLIAYDRLDGPTRRSLGAITDDPDFYGLLVASENSRAPTRVVSNDAALLLHELVEPAQAPHLLASVFGAAAEERLRELIADGILEVERGDGFVSGAAAFPDEDRATISVTSRVAELSLQAVEHAATLVQLPIRDLARSLYHYNRVPCSPAHRRRLGSAHDVLAFLSGTAASARELEAWTIAGREGGWIHLRRELSASDAPYKLFVSPTLESVPEALAATLTALRRVGCHQAKVGGDALGLLRPDKLVAYFATLDDLQRAAGLILGELSGAPVQGVPFSGLIDLPGLTSWGMDPPGDLWDAGAGPRSWRQWVVERAAVHLATAVQGGSPRPAADAIRRLGGDGIDTTTWSPSLAIWRRE